METRIMFSQFVDRTEAGRLLADRIADYRGWPGALVLALPRGGVPVGFEVARILPAPLDVLVVRKLGAPGQPELAMGAVASAGVRVLNEEIIESLRIDPAALEAIAAEEEAEVRRRERAYRGGECPPLDVHGRLVFLVDDGLATGATMRAAVAAVRAMNAGRVVVAVPVAPADAVARLSREADEVVCLSTPPSFHSIGQWYQDFPQVSDHEVRHLLARAPKDTFRHVPRRHTAVS